MKQEELSLIYPSATWLDTPCSQSNVFTIKVGEKWFCLPETKLSSSEKKLLQTIYPVKKTMPFDQVKHPWYGYLFENKPLPSPNGTYRILQFQVTSLDKDFSIEDWFVGFKAMFSHYLDAFFLEETSGLLIEKKQTGFYTIEELSGILHTLDADFACKSKAFLGNFLHTDENLPELFLEERNIYQQEKDRMKGDNTFSLAQVALHYFTKDALILSPTMQSLKHNLTFDSDMRSIILTLWNNQANISSTAKELFLHRNTLQYRIEKFNEQTGFSLKKLDDLFLCYLLIQ